MAKLEKADKAMCFTSGMAALTTVTHLVEAGDFLPLCILTFTILHNNLIKLLL